MIVLRLVFLIFICVGMAMFTLWQSKQVVRMGYQITSLEEKKATLEEKNRKLESQINTLRSPENILRHLDDMNLKLLPPGEEMEDSIFTARLKNKKGP